MASAERREIIEAFRSVDPKGTGRLHREDMLAIFRSLAHFSDWSEEEYRQLFDYGDASGSGAIDYATFLDWILSVDDGAEVAEAANAAQLVLGSSGLQPHIDEPDEACSPSRAAPGTSMEEDEDDEEDELDQDFLGAFVAAAVVDGAEGD
mmetsp:Transcript_38131/g.89383  ORF Transcript_38131/g.89383 Transcript_38131/m.89383 type:complete len:150 (+) Transcript_38131:109-558(+)